MKKYEKYFTGKNRGKKAAAGSLLCVLTILLAGCGWQMRSSQSVDTAMGTVISQTIYHTGREPITDEVLQAIEALEQEKISWRIATSEVAQINAAAGKGAVEVSADLAEVLSESLAVSADSDGAFDLSIGQLSRLWDIDHWAAETDTEGYPVPEPEQIRAALETTGWQRIQLTQRADGTAAVELPAGMQLDLGAVGKGMVLDEIWCILEDHTEVTGAVISAGGSILTYGSKPEGGAWNVAVADPADPSGSVGVLSLEGDFCVSTSGDYERYVEVDGVRYHHILDAKTGYPADSGLAGVTIVSESGIYSDALSTACFVLGEEAGRKLLAHYDAEGLFIDHEGNITMTAGMEQYFHLSNSEK